MDSDEVYGLYDDDDFNDLPLDELEQTAIQQTQRQQTQQPVKQEPSRYGDYGEDYGDEYGDELMEDAEVIDMRRPMPPLLRDLERPKPGQPERQLSSRVQRARLDVGLGVEAGDTQLQQDIETTQHDLQILGSRPHSLTQDLTELRTMADVPGGAGTVDANSQLLARIEDLLRENRNLKQDLTAKTGEISIVRSKHERAVKDHERELRAIRHLHEETSVKHQRELEATKDAERKAATELEFTKRDLFEEAERARSLRKARQAEPQPVEQTTPKKSKKQLVRDGFDDDDMVMISPSKLQGRRSNHGTPTKQGKRKRKGIESPVAAALEVTIDEPTNQDIVVGETLKIYEQDERFDFLQSILDYRPSQTEIHTFESLTKLSFPTSTESVAAMLLSKLSIIGQKKAGVEFVIEFCQLLIELWQRCLDESYHQPIPLLLDLLSFSLETHTFNAGPMMIDTLLPIIQSTGDLVAIPRFQYKKPSDSNIDLSACLSNMYLAAISCLTDLNNIAHFWKLIRQDFVLMLLSPQQRIADFELMLRIIGTSSLAESIGPILGDAVKQQEQAVYLIDRITMSFFWTPLAELDQQAQQSQSTHTPQGASQAQSYQPRHNPTVLAQMHFRGLCTLHSFCQSNWASEAIARHTHAIGRLVRLLSDELDALYNYTPHHRLSSQIINLTVRLLRHIIITHERHINMQRKLSAVQGGMQKYLTCLARLSFSEDDLVLEAGIDAEVAECAHELLELIVTPEEGDAIHSAFTIPAS